MLVHVPPGIIAFIALQVCGISPTVGWTVLCGIAIPLVLADAYRVWCHHQARRYPDAYRWFTAKTEPWLIRNLHLKYSEYAALSAMATYAMGIAVTYMFCSDPVTLWAILILAFGDPAAGFVGRRTRKKRLKNGKSFAGFAAFCGVSFFVLMLSNILQSLWPMEGIVGWSRGLIVVAQCVGILAGGVAELLFRFDNFIIPVASGGVMEIILRLC